MKKTVTLLCAALLLLPFGCTSEDIPGGNEENTPEETKLPDPALSWSAASCTQTIEEENPSTYPTLTADPGDLTITFASSNTSVATIDGSGNITLVAPGSSTISATFAGNDAYNAATATYTLIVLSNANDGAVTTNFDSSGDTSSDDYIRMMASPSVTVTAGSGAGHGLKTNDYVQLSDGKLEVTTSGATKKAITTDGYVLVEGGTSVINVSGGVAYDSNDAEYKGSAGIKADNYFGMTGGSVTITNTGAGGKGLSAGSQDFEGDIADSYISGGSLSITTTGSETNDVSAKGIKIGWATKVNGKVTASAGNFYISGGSVNVNAAKCEGLEAKGDLVISDSAEVYVVSTGDDAINCQGELDVTGGYVYAYSSANDAMDANHDLKISGGYVFAVTTRGAPEVALDANTEENYKLYITGGVVVAYGGLEGGYSASNTVYTMNCTAGNWNALHDGSSYIAAFKAPAGVSSVAVCAPSLKKGYKGVSVGGDTYAGGTWATTSISGGSSVSLGTYTGGGGQGGNPPGGGPGGGH